ncbi:hypothetical protein AK88_05504, partial [Plasmodium fragile]
MQRSLWQDIEDQLKKFMKHLDDPIVELYAANCSNRGYTYPPKGNNPVVANVGDTLMCKLMTGALYFMNENSWNMGRANTVVTNDDELKEY